MRSGLESIQPSPSGTEYYVKGADGKVDTWSVGSRYKLDRLVGEGSFSCVCLATCKTTGERVALKRIPDVLDSLDNAKQVLRECAILRRLRHPGIVKLLDAFMTPSSTGRLQYRGGRLEPTSYDLYMALEFCNQGDVFHMRGQLAESEVKSLMWQLLHVLQYIHSCNVWHRDIKSANILMSLEHGRRIVKLCDFGSARSAVAAADGVARLDSGGKAGASPSQGRADHSSMPPSCGAHDLAPQGPHQPAPPCFHNTPSQQLPPGGRTPAMSALAAAASAAWQQGSSTAATQLGGHGAVPEGGAGGRFTSSQGERGATGIPCLLTHVVCTPCYRAPEVIMSHGAYSSAMDLWSLGCVFGEMLQRIVHVGASSTPQLQVAPVIGVSGQPLTPRHGEHYQDGPSNPITRQELGALFAVIGTPAWGTVRAVVKHPAWQVYLKEIPGRQGQLYRRFRPAGDAAVDLLIRLLEFDPGRRASAREALAHEYFRDLKQLSHPSGSPGLVALADSSDQEDEAMSDHAPLADQGRHGASSTASLPPSTSWPHPPTLTPTIHQLSHTHLGGPGQPSGHAAHTLPLLPVGAAAAPGSLVAEPAADDCQRLGTQSMDVSECMAQQPQAGKPEGIGPAQQREHSPPVWPLLPPLPPHPQAAASGLAGPPGWAELQRGRQVPCKRGLSSSGRDEGGDGGVGRHAGDDSPNRARSRSQAPPREPQLPPGAAAALPPTCDMAMPSTAAGHPQAADPMAVDQGHSTACTAGEASALVDEQHGLQPATAGVGLCDVRGSSGARGELGPGASPQAPRPGLQVEQAPGGGAGPPPAGLRKVPSYNDLHDPAQALAMLEQELTAVCDAAGIDRLHAMLQRECDEVAAARQKAIQQQLAGAATPSLAAYRRSSAGGHGRHLKLEGLQPDPGAHVDACDLGKQRLPHHADTEQAGLLPEQHLRAGRHGEWAPLSLPDSLVKTGHSHSWGVTLDPPGMQLSGVNQLEMEGLMEAIRQQQWR